MTEPHDYELYGFWYSSATYRVRVAMNLKGLTAVEHGVDLAAGEQHGAAFRAISPLGGIPALVIKGHAPITQSGAILEFLDEAHPLPPLLPRFRHLRRILHSNRRSWPQHSALSGETACAARRTTRPSPQTPVNC